MKPTRNLAFGCLTALLAAVVVAAGAEILTRLLVPEEVFWPIGNIYRRAEDDSLGYTYRENFRGTAFGADLTTNSEGFRGGEWSPEARQGVLRIALIGDSIGFGFGVEPEESLAGLLPAAVRAAGGPPSEVLNFAVNGYNSQQQLASLGRALEYSPHLVLLMPANNDHKPALLVDGEGWLHWDGSEDPTTRVPDRAIQQGVTDHASTWLRSSRAYLYLRLQLRRRAAGEGGDEEAPVPTGSDGRADNGGWPGPLASGPISQRLRTSVHEPLEEMIRQARTGGAAVVLAPYVGVSDYRAMMARLAEDREVPIVDLLGLFPEVGSLEEFLERFSLGWDSHPGPEVQRRWARALGPVVAEAARGASLGDSKLP